MNQKKLHRVLIACALAPSIVSAQTDDPLDQIIVTGARSPLSISQVGAAVSVIDREQIERREARNIAELLRSVPGFAVSQTGVAGSQTQVRVRGAEANHLLVLIDGVRATDPATGDEFRWEFLSTAAIERVEIVRGSQSALWGSDAIAGVVNIITRVPDSGGSLGGYAEAGSFGTANAAINGYATTGRWSFSGGIEQLTTDGANIARQGTEDDDSELATVNLNTRFRASESVELRAGIRAVDAYSQFDPVDFFTTGLPVDGDVATDTTNLYGNVDLLVARGRVRHTFRARYFESDNDNRVAGSVDSSQASDRITLTYQADISLGDNLLVLAAEHESTDFEQRGQVNFGDPNQDQSIDVTSGIVEFQGLSYDRLSWIASLRFDSNSDFDDALNGRLSAAFALTDTTSVRASVGTGRKNPTFTERFGFFPGQFIGNVNLDPERSTSYEIGLDQRFADGAGLLQLTIFDQDLDDEINGFVFDPVTFLSTAENIDGTSDRDGVEVALSWATNEQLDLGLHYTYTDSRDEFATELRRPRHTGGVSASYTGEGERFRLHLNADYGGDRRDVFFPPFPTPSEVVTLADYWLIDVAVHYRLSDSVELFARGTNLLDETYEEVFGYRTLPRAGFVGARMQFGN